MKGRGGQLRYRPATPTGWDTTLLKQIDAQLRVIEQAIAALIDADSTPI